MGMTNPYRRGVERPAIGAPEDSVHKFGFGGASELFGERDGFVDGGVGRDFFEEEKLVKTKM